MLARLGILESKTFGVCNLKKEFIFVIQTVKGIEIKFKNKKKFKNYIVKAGCLRICFLQFIAPRVQFCN